MNTIIKQKLKDIEKQENVKIILAIESGSRAWGFESPDSDYDVRFIYIREKDSYLKLEGIRDVIEWQLDDTLDINGWDIQKVLRLLYKSNPTLLEWCNSPIVYKEESEFKLLKKCLEECFSRQKGMYHYLHMTKRNYDELCKKNQIKAKKYFYVLRPLLAAKWIINEKSMAPVKFEVLVNSQLEENMKPIVNQLLNIKMNAPELHLINRIPELDKYIENTMQWIQENSSIEDKQVS
ncbi:MAG: nucleotidyltransferase domain-containing protein [Coprobacillaceae bacterium]